MRIPGLKTAKRARRWLSSRFARHAILLGYHRVANVSRDPYRICVSPENFADHLDVLHRITSPISLSCLFEGLESRQMPERSVVITFDDGYADLLENAKPLLERYNTPATVFIVTGFLGSQYWWDRLEAILLTPETLPKQLDLSIGGIPFKWQAKDTGLKNHVKGGVDAREQVLLKIYPQLLKIHTEERERSLAALDTWAGSDRAHPGAAPRALAAHEIIRLTADGLIEIGSHTATHPWLSELPLTLQRSEISESKAHLERIIGRNVTSLSYPNGSTSEEVVSLVRQAGYRCACTSDNGIVSLSTNPFRLPRFWVPNWDGATFERWLRRWI